VADRNEIAQLASQLWADTLLPQPLAPGKAWLGIYRVLLWYESAAEGPTLPHIVSTHHFRGSAGGARKANRTWIRRAQQVNALLAKEFGCRPMRVPGRVDGLMRMPRFRGVQRNNPLGIAFTELVAHVLRKFGAQHLEYRTHVASADLFPCVTLKSKNRHPRADIAVLRDGAPVAVITTAWSVRYDRFAKVIDESAAYRSAATQCGLRLPCFFVTNEYSPARLAKVMSSGVLECVVHVCPRIVTEVCDLDGRLGKLKDLPYLIQQTQTWGSPHGDS